MNTGALIQTGDLANTGGLAQSAKPRAKQRANTASLISAHYLEIEYLLERVEASRTHYQALGLERSATSEEIILAYQQTVSALHPSYHKVRNAVPDEMLERIDKAFNRVSKAFSVLTSHRKRAEYDASLHRRAVTPLPLDVPRSPKLTDERAASRAKTNSEPSRTDCRAEKEALDTIEIKASALQRPVFTKPSGDAEAVNRRRCERIKLTVPVLVAGYDRASGKWQEVTSAIDVSRTGVALRLCRRVRHGAVLHVTLPLPAKLRSHGFSEPGYNVYAIVRRIEPAKEGMRVVGLEFLGAHPPAGYLRNPSATFRTEKWTGVERRREPRHKRCESVLIEYLNEEKLSVSVEVTTTENISASGARVLSKAAPAEFETVRLINHTCGFASIALVCNRYTGDDGFERLCLQFVEQKWPI